MKVMGKHIRLAVIGTRTYTNRKRVYFELDELAKLYRIDVIISGCAEDDDKAKGPDAFARDWAKERGVPYKGYPAKWDDFSPPCLRRTGLYGEYNALAGPNRNTLIAEDATNAIAFHDRVSTGTADCISKFESRGKKVKTIKV